MPTLFVTQSVDHRGSTLTDVDTIQFAGSEFARVIFNADQFGNGQIDIDVHVVGDAHRNFVDVFLQGNGSAFSAHEWTFENWVDPTFTSVDQVDIFGTAGGDLIFGSTRADAIVGDAGNDSLQGMEGNDGLLGGSGRDTLRGGSGDDTYFLSDIISVGSFPVSFEFDAVIEEADEGIDKVLVQRAVLKSGLVGDSYTLPTNVEQGFVQNGTGGFRLTGNDLGNVLQGNDSANALGGLGGADTIGGGAGNDTIRGGAGFDLLTGDAGFDLFDFDSASEIGNANGSRDIIGDFLPGQDVIDLAGIDANTILAAHQAFTFIGTAAHTGAGATLRYQHGTGVTLLFGDLDADGAGDFAIQLTGTLALKAADFTDGTIAAVQGTAAADTLEGSAGSELVTGLAGADLLSGLAGVDTLRGGNGFDTMTGGADADRFDFNTAAEIGNASGSRDVITDFEQGIDRIDLDDVDALTTVAGGQAFTWLGTAPHSGVGATLRYVQSGGNTLLFGDVDADSVGDFTIQLNGLHDLVAADFTNLSIDTIQGTAAAESLAGAPGGKIMLGLEGDDTITGAAGADTIFGGAGTDAMTGALGFDVFAWNLAAHTGVNAGTRDIIADFQQGVDRIDLSAIDANTTVAGNQAFVFLGDAAHTGAGGTLRAQQSGGNTIVFGDRDADGAADFAIQLTGLYTLTASDFVL